MQGSFFLVLSPQYFKLITAQFRISHEEYHKGAGSHIISMYQMSNKIQSRLLTNTKTPSLWRLIDIKEKKKNFHKQETE